MNYYKFQIRARAETAEMIMAWMSNLPFDMFQETEEGFDAYLRAEDDSASVDEMVSDLQDQFVFSVEKSFVPGQNWNEEWEANFHPVIVDDFCGIRADFHQPLTGIRHELVITPRMAFGTGHHETTFMMVQLMRDLDFTGQQVLDYGCGTGILAILASRLGAQSIDAVDIEEESYLNTIDNSRCNQIDNVRAFHGILDDIPGNAYDTILANINRNVILDSLPALSKLQKTSNLLLISGFVADDEAKLRDSLAAHHYQVVKWLQKNQWLAMVCERI